MSALGGRVALVTGGSRGIGRGIAVELAAAGVTVAVGYRRDEGAAAETVAEIERRGGRGIAVRASLDLPEEVDALVAEATGRLGPIGILVANAGIASRGAPVADTDPEELRRVIAIHALATHRLCQLVIPGMRELERGDIVMISSTEVEQMRAGGAPYNMAKAAMEALAYTLAHEEARHGIRVNVVAPGLVATEMGDRLVRAKLGLESAADLDARQPFGRVVRPADVGRVVRFLVGSDAELVTGQRIAVDGGQHPALLDVA
jgi:NAD(P)-dependent dehydrogenase (short-subunit alcohol dehydrogenase family)